MLVVKHKTIQEKSKNTMTLDDAIQSLDRYQHHKIPTGSFLRAVLENDLTEALGRADAESLANLKEIHMYIYNHLPSDIWGSRSKVTLHLVS